MCNQHQGKKWCWCIDTTIRVNNWREKRVNAHYFPQKIIVPIVQVNNWEGQRFHGRRECRNSDIAQLTAGQKNAVNAHCFPSGKQLRPLTKGQSGVVQIRCFDANSNCVKCPDCPTNRTIGILLLVATSLWRGFFANSSTLPPPVEDKRFPRRISHESDFLI